MSSYYVPDPNNPYKPWVAPAAPAVTAPPDPNIGTAASGVGVDSGGSGGNPLATVTSTGPASAADLAAWYQNWLAQDPTLQAVLAGINATGSAYKGQLGNEEAQLLEQYGAVPAGASQYAQFLDPTVAGIADANTQGGTSTLAQLARAYAQSHASTLDSLAARGMIRSGALGVHENNDLTQSNQAQYDALQKLLSGLGTNYSTYLGQQDQLGQETATANSTAMQRLTDLINNGTITAPTTKTTSVAAPNPAPVAPNAPSPSTSASGGPGPNTTNTGGPGATGTVVPFSQIPGVSAVAAPSTPPAQLGRNYNAGFGSGTVPAGGF